MAPDVMEAAKAAIEALGQPAAGQNEDGEDWGQQGRALLFPRQDAADTRLGFPGGAGQRGGEGGAWDGFHKIAS